MRLRRSVTALSVVATLAAFAAMPIPPAYADSTTDTYIVQLKSGVSADKMASKLMGSGAKVIHKVFQGGIVTLNAAQAKALAASPYVASVHKDAVISASVTQTGAPWDLDILDSRTATLDQTYTSPNDGSSVTVYVVDSGILRTHSEFASATIAAGYNFVENNSDTSDCQGHGTAVSSLIAGATLGASKGVTLVPVRVLNCDGIGKESDIIRAADWIAANRALGPPAVANLSFGAKATDLPAGDTSIDAAFQGLIDQGVTVVAAAGNERIDACGEVPARVPDAITVAASTSANTEPSWKDAAGKYTLGTNYGRCVDLYAPGDSVKVANSTGQFLYGSGTSFSAPLTAAAAAQVLHDHPTWSPAAVSADLLARASYGVITGARSANRLLNVGPLGTYSQTAVSIDSTGLDGEAATAVLDWSPLPPETVLYAWSQNGTPIPGATGQTYTLTKADIGQSITVTATAVGGGYTSASATSDPIVPRFGLPMTPGTPTITGGAAVSYTLTATPGAWDPADVVLTYQWRSDGTPIPGASGSTYAPVAADVGHALTFAVTGHKTDYYLTTAVSAPTDVIQSATSPLAYTPFVKASYQDFLGRPPTVDDLATQTDALSSGTLTTGSYLSSLATSDEWLSAIVTKMYSDTLDRQPDAAGLAGWVSWLRSGRFTVAQVASLFYASDEYYIDHAGNSPTSWVTLLYQKLLNRDPDAPGLAAWVTYTNDPRYGKSWVAYQFFQSPESRMFRVEHLYQTLLHREPDATGWPYWTQSVLTTGDLTLAINLASSQEYWESAHVRY